MSAPDIAELLDRAAPSPATTLDMAAIEGRGRRRRRRRRIGLAGALLAVGLIIGTVAVLPGTRADDTVVAGRGPGQRIPVEAGAGRTTVDVDLLDGTRLRVTMPNVVGGALKGATMHDLALAGSVSVDPTRGRAWRIEVSIGSVADLIPDGEPLPVATSSASAALVDRPGHRLGLQFGAWAFVASGDSLTEPEITTLLDSITFAETPEGFVEYRGTLPLWVVDSPDATITRGGVSLSLTLPKGPGGGCLPQMAARTASGYAFERIDKLSRSGPEIRLCAPANGIDVGISTPRPLTDEEVDQVALEVVSVGSTLAAIQRGQHP